MSEGTNSKLTERQWQYILKQFYWTDNWNCSTYKLLSALSRKTAIEEYVWKSTPENAFRSLKNMCVDNNITENEARESFAALQAYTVEVLERTNFPGKNPDGTVSIMRTEA